MQSPALFLATLGALSLSVPPHAGSGPVRRPAER